MNQKQWGPPAWSMLHSLAKRAESTGSVGDDIKIRRMLRDLPYMLPCKYCRNHSKKYYRDKNVNSRLKRGESPRKILNELHIHVNTRLGKPPTKSLHRVVPGDMPKFLLAIAYNYPLQGACKNRMQKVTRFMNCALSLKQKPSIQQSCNRSCLVKSLRANGEPYRRFSDEVRHWRINKKK